MRIIRASLKDLGGYLYHSTPTVWSLLSILSTNPPQLRTRVEYHEKAIGKDGSYKTGAKKTSIDLSGDLRANIDSMGSGTKGKFIVEIDKSALQETLNQLYEKKAISVADTETIDVYKAFKLYFIVPSNRSVTLMIEEGEDHKRTNLEKRGIKKTVKFSQDVWDKISDDLLSFPHQGTIKNKGKDNESVSKTQFTFDVPVASTELSSEAYQAIIRNRSIWEAQESIVLGPRPYDGFDYKAATNTPYVWALPITVNRVIILEDGYNGLDEDAKQKLEETGYEITVMNESNMPDAIISNIIIGSENVAASYKVDNKITFKPKNQYGIKMYFSDNHKRDDWSENWPRYSVLFDEETKRYLLRIWEDRSFDFGSRGQDGGSGWAYPIWDNLPFGSGFSHEGFPSLAAVSEWLSRHDWKNATPRRIEPLEGASDELKQDMIDAAEQLGFERDMSRFYKDKQETEPVFIRTWKWDDEDQILGYSDLTIRLNYYSDSISVTAWLNNKRIYEFEASSVPRMVAAVERLLKQYNVNKDIMEAIMMSAREDREAVMSAINTRNLASNIVRVKSSNLWGYAINVKKHGDKTGDVIAQFKSETGGAGALYIYYDVPVQVYRRWVSAPSKGSFFWKHIRNVYKYSKLTGDKRGKLKNAINH